MRLLLLVAVLACGLSAAEREKITLTDGRVLVGVYDDLAGTITLDGIGGAVLKIREHQVKAREPAPAPAPPPPVSPKPAPAIDEGEISKAPPAAVAERPEVAMRAMIERHQRELFEYACDWISRADLSEVPVPQLGNDPRASEQEAFDLAKQANHQLREAREAQEFIKAGVIEKRWGNAQHRVTMMLLNGEVQRAMAARDAARAAVRKP